MATTAQLAPEIQRRVETLIDLDAVAPEVRREVGAELLYALQILPRPIPAPVEAVAS